MVIHQWLVDSPHKGPVMQKVFPCFDIIMLWGLIISACQTRVCCLLASHVFCFQKYHSSTLDMSSANERPCYNVTLCLIGWAHTQNDPCIQYACVYTNMIFRLHWLRQLQTRLVICDVTIFWQCYNIHYVLTLFWQFYNMHHVITVFQQSYNIMS